MTTLLRQFYARIRSLVRRDRLDKEFDDELAIHLEMAALLVVLLSKGDRLARNSSDRVGGAGCLHASGTTSHTH